jgi:glycosyltransferase involved in cell wall biosynthesis
VATPHGVVALLDVVVPTFNNLGDLQACLESLAKDTHELRVLICVDGSTDGTLAFLDELQFPHELKVLEHPDRRNRGRAAARNLALHSLSSTTTLLLDSDMRLDPGAIEAHLTMLNDPTAISVGDVVYENAKSSLWARYLATRGKNKAGHGGAVSPLYLASGNVALPSEALLKAGGFDPQLSSYGLEDTELGLRLAELGYRLFFNAEARATTVESKTVKEALREMRRLGQENLPLVRRSHPAGPAPFWIDRFESPRLRDRMLRFLMNPVTDALVGALLPFSPFSLQRTLLNYQVLRAVWRGYRDAMRRPAV